MALYIKTQHFENGICVYFQVKGCQEAILFTPSEGADRSNSRPVSGVMSSHGHDSVVVSSLQGGKN
jgi:hypothetical protein